MVPGVNAINIFYSLGNAAERVTIDILDARGQLVRSFNGEPSRKARTPVRNSLGHVINGPRWGSATPDPAVPTTAGLHRVTWDLRYPPATDFEGLRLRDSNVDGPHALRLLQESGLDVPFILISGTVGEDAAVAAMKEGANDYLIKDRLIRLGTGDLLCGLVAQFEKQLVAACIFLQFGKERFGSAEVLERVLCPFTHIRRPWAGIGLKWWLVACSQPSRPIWR